eukprot:scaffold1638_cov112-Skeletonema_dohrnii-CCMP3373.AAC.14
MYLDTVAEWLRRSTRNRLGLSRVGSSPASVTDNLLSPATGDKQSSMTWPFERVRVCQGWCEFFAKPLNAKQQPTSYSQRYLQLSLSLEKAMLACTFKRVKGLHNNMNNAAILQVLLRRRIFVLLLLVVVVASVAVAVAGQPNSSCMDGSVSVSSEDDGKNDVNDVYSSRMDDQNHEDKEYIKVVQEALTFASRLKDNPHQFVITDTDDEGKNNIPVIDLSLNDEAAAQDIFDAATKWGFFQITNHGLDQHLIDEMFDVNRRFMALDDMTKTMYKFDRKAICGYEKATQVHPSSGIRYT